MTVSRPMPKPMLVAGNWKMNKTPEEASGFLNALKNLTTTSPVPAGRTLILFVPGLVAETVGRETKGSAIQWGGQNSHFESKGAFTGENSPSVLKTMGARHVLVGHSERRTIFKEDDALCAKKVSAIQALGLTPMLCIGETLDEREKGLMKTVLERQLVEGLKTLDKNTPFNLAYEPVWAIGTGKVATPEQVAEAHAFIRSLLKLHFVDMAQIPPLLYGGSVTAQNASALAQIPDVNGFLIGGASLDPQSLLTIAQS